MKDQSDGELSRQCKQGNPVAWRVLIERHTPMVLRLAIRTLRNESDAQDACQEVFMRVMRSFETYDPTRPLKPWIGRITFNVCQRLIERRARRGEQLHDDFEGESTSDLLEHSPESMTSQKESVRILDHALNKIPTKDRMLVVMRYREELSESEMAEATNMPIGTIKTRLHRARKKLKAILTSPFRECN